MNVLSLEDTQSPPLEVISTDGENVGIDFSSLGTCKF